MAAVRWRVRGEKAGVGRRQTTHSQQTNDAMSEPVPRLPRRKGAKQRINWLTLFREVEAGEACTVVGPGG